MSERVCQGCGVELPPSKPRGRPRKWCSERCRKGQYDRVCVGCGGRVDGTTPGKSPAESVCQRCAPAHYRVWTREAILEAVRRFADEYGRAPRVQDFSVTARNGQPGRRPNGYWPGVYTIWCEFGSFSAAIHEAGLEPFSHRRDHTWSPGHPIHERAAA